MRLVFTLMAAVIPFVTALPSAGQATVGKKAWIPPRTTDGQPDLQGVWSNATITPLERPTELAGKPFFTKAEAATYEKKVRENSNADRRPTDAATDVYLAYNDAWWDSGSNVVKTMRTSMIVDPADGRLPALTADGERRAATLAEQRKLHPADGPESRSLSERCVFKTTAGPPMLPSAYNNNYQIFQSPGYVAIEIEMIHNVRIIPLGNRPHLPSNVRQWMGDSRGRWEGETLVVETTNFNDKTKFQGASEKMRLTERFTRTEPDTILYEFTVDDPATYTKPWTAQLTMSRAENRLYEYACHEGNYGLKGILSGARAQEKSAASGK